MVRQAGAEGKRLRPTILLLMASTLSAVVPNPHYLTVDERPPNVHPEEVTLQGACPCFPHIPIQVPFVWQSGW